MKAEYFGSLGVGCFLLMAAALQASAQQTAKPVTKLDGVWLVSDSRGASGKHSVWTPELLPFTPKGLEMFQTNKPGRGPRAVSSELQNDPLKGANPPGLYRALIYPRPFQMVQLPDKVIQMFGWGKNWRSIYTDGRPVPDDIPAGPYWYGYSVGRWEGDTLVVTTLALDERAWFDEWGVPISEDARVEERWKRVGDKLQLKLTVNDPLTYTKPWSSKIVTFALKHVEPEEIILAPMDQKSVNEKLRYPADTPAKK